MRVGVGMWKVVRVVGRIRKSVGQRRWNVSRAQSGNGYTSSSRSTTRSIRSRSYSHYDTNNPSPGELTSPFAYSPAPSRTRNQRAKTHTIPIPNLQKPPSPSSVHGILCSHNHSSSSSAAGNPSSHWPNLHSSGIIPHLSASKPPPAILESPERCHLCVGLRS